MKKITKISLGVGALVLLVSASTFANTNMFQGKLLNGYQFTTKPYEDAPVVAKQEQSIPQIQFQTPTQQAVAVAKPEQLLPQIQFQTPTQPAVVAKPKEPLTQIQFQTPTQPAVVAKPKEPLTQIQFRTPTQPVAVAKPETSCSNPVYFRLPEREFEAAGWESRLYFGSEQDFSNSFLLNRLKDTQVSGVVGFDINANGRYEYQTYAENDSRIFNFEEGRAQVKLLDINYKSGYADLEICTNIPVLTCYEDSCSQIN
jgi:hypothetical protein